MRPDRKGPRKFRLHRGRTAKPKPPAEPPCPLSQAEIQILGTYNAERSRGILHDDRWQAEMARMQRRFDKWQRDCTDTWNAWSLGLSIPEWREYERTGRRPGESAG